MKPGSLYDNLEIKKEATDKEIRSAYRKLSKKYHPDSPQGSKIEFECLKQAYDILIDPDRRARYNSTGRTDESVATEARIKTMIANAVEGILNGPVNGIIDDPVWTDVKDKVHKSLKRAQEEIHRNMHDTQRKLERAHRLSERFKTKMDQDPVGDALKASIFQLKELMRQHEDAMELSLAVEKVFNGYDYEVGPGPEGQFSPGPPLRRGTMILGNSLKA